MKSHLSFLLTLLMGLSAHAGAQSHPAQPWYRQAMRWGQVNINELDAQRFDVGWWMDYFRRCHVDGITINAAGLVAYYPSQIPLHPRSRFLGPRDLFGEIVGAARKANLHVLARFDPSYQREDFYAAHKDWFSLDKEGKPNILSWPPVPREKLYMICPNSPYFWDYIPKVFEEILTRYDVDGVFGNAWDGYDDICYCPYCRSRFQRDTGLALPATEDRSNPVYRAWVTWHYRRLADVWQHWSETVKRVKPGAIFVPNQTSIAGMRGFIERGQEVLQVENQGRGPNTPLWQIGMTAKLLRALSGGERPYWITIGYYLPGWRHIAKPEPEQRIWLADAVANGARPWFHVVGAAQDDQRGFKAFEDFFSLHQKNQRDFQGLKSRAEVALVYSQATLDFYRLSAEAAPLGSPPAVAESVRGAYQALLESRVPFDMLLAEDLAKSLPGRYRVIVLPNVAMLSEESARAVREFVERGGGAVATFETGLYDATGNRRTDFALSDLFRVHATSNHVLGPLGHSYMRIKNGDGLAKEFAGTVVLPNTRYLVPVKAEGTAEAPLTLIPAYPVYPPETSWTQTERSDISLAFFRATGAGRVAYFPGDLAATFGATHLPDHARLLRYAIDWARGETPSSRAEGTGFVDFSLYESERGKKLVAFLVNLSNPAAWQPPLTEIVSAGKQVISLPLRPGQRCRAVRLLVDDRAGKFSQSGENLTVTIPNLRDFEVAVADLE